MRIVILVVLVLAVLAVLILVLKPFSGHCPAQLETGRSPSTAHDSLHAGFRDSLRDSTRANEIAQVDTSDLRSVIGLQVALSRAGFSPGIIDGRLGKNTLGAVTWFQKAENLPATANPDMQTLERLRERGAESAAAGEVLLRYAVTDSDLAGPFVIVPKDVYERERLKCLCYESPLEEIAERFHTSEELLQKLNPGLNESPASGTDILVPNVRPMKIPADSMSVRVEHLLVSKKGFYVLALDGAGRVIRFFPCTVGSEYDPSPNEKLRTTKVSWFPWFHYQPKLFADVSDRNPEAKLPPGPNSPVGVVWIDLSKEHYGIHGTAEPQTIGYTTSHGCIRLTNWDAASLAGSLTVGAAVEFPD